MSIICKPAHNAGADVNLTSARSDLADKLQEVIPVVEFYREFTLGWKRRLNLAVSAVKQLPANDKRNRQIISELITVAEREVAVTKDAYTAIDNIKTKLEEKIQDLDLLALKNSTHSELTAADIGITEIQRLLHTSDALLELRGSQTKELTS